MAQNIITISFNTSDKMSQDDIEEMRRVLYDELKLFLREKAYHPNNLVASVLSQ